MQVEDTSFLSDELRLAARFYWPDDRDAAREAPLVIPCSGFTGLMRIHPERFARYLTRRGWACFAFDYRGFVDSEGPRNRVVLDEQIRDIRHGAAFASADARIDASRIVLLGWGMAGGLVIDAARELAGVVGLVAANGFFVGRRVQRAHRSEADMRTFEKEVDAERRERVRSGKARQVDPFDLYPLDAGSRRYVDDVLRKTPGYEAEKYSYELAESLLRFDVEAYAPAMSLPLLIAHGDQNKLHPTVEAQSLQKAWGGPVDLFWLEGAGHTEFMADENPKFQTLAGRIDAWLKSTVPTAP